MQARAIIENWDVPLAQRAKIIARLVEIVEKSDSEREAIGAAKALLTIPRTQIDASRLQIEQQQWKKEREGSSVDLQDLLTAHEQYDQGPGPDSDPPVPERSHPVQPGGAQPASAVEPTG